jgi:orotidine-5'-phosphate decarboxylase
VHKKRLILSLDGLNDMYDILHINMLASRVYAFKIHDYMDKKGPIAIHELKEAGASRVWADVKLHDIPATVKNRASALKENGADIVTVHASGGIEMMRAAVDTGIEVYAVTILTSLTDEDCFKIYGSHTTAAVLTLAENAKEAGCTGVVCSPLEVASLATNPKLNGMRFITPGVRSPGTSTDDQQRTNTPVEALQSGATNLVIGRQVTQSNDPIRTFKELEAEISAFV